MALVNCPECGKEISNKAISCPHCGYYLNYNEDRIANEKKIEAQNKWKSAVIVLLIVGAIIPFVIGDFFIYIIIFGGIIEAALFIVAMILTLLTSINGLKLLLYALVLDIGIIIGLIMQIFLS